MSVSKTTYARQRLIGLLGKAESVLGYLKGGAGSGNFAPGQGRGVGKPDSNNRVPTYRGEFGKLKTPGATLRFGVGGDSTAYEIRGDNGALAHGYVYGADFPKDYSSSTRGELFWVDAGSVKRFGVGTSLAIDSFRVMLANGAKTVNMSGVSDDGRLLIASLERSGYITQIRTSPTGKSEFLINVDKFPKLVKNFVLKGGQGSGYRGHAGRPGIGVGGSAPKSGIRGEKLPPEKRVWQGQQQGSTNVYSRLDRQAIGVQGEVIARGVMEQLRGEKFDSLSSVISSSPLDLLGNNSAVEVKTGTVGNAPKSQHWRITLGQMGQEETMLVRKMTPLQRKFYYKSKMKYISMRKTEMMRKLGRSLNKKFNPFTMGVIMSSSGRADVFLIPGFHDRLSWKQYAIDKFYVGTYSMEQISENTGY